MKPFNCMQIICIRNSYYFINISYLKPYLNKSLDRKLQLNKAQLHEKYLLVTENQIIA